MLRRRCRGGRIALGIGRALAFLHDDLGVVHLDIKSTVGGMRCVWPVLAWRWVAFLQCDRPAAGITAHADAAADDIALTEPMPHPPRLLQNVLLTLDGSSVKVADAGLARTLGASSVRAGRSLLGCRACVWGGEDIGI